MLDVGEFCIALKLDPSEAGINIKNLRYGKDSSYQHPHVSGAGSQQSICWGSIRNSVLKLLRDWDFLSLIQLIWNFLNSYHSGDSYVKMLNLWNSWTKETLPSPERMVKVSHGRS